MVIYVPILGQISVHKWSEYISHTFQRMPLVKCGANIGTFLCLKWTTNGPARLNGKNWNITGPFTDQFTPSYGLSFYRAAVYYGSSFYWHPAGAFFFTEGVYINTYYRLLCNVYRQVELLKK